MSSTTQEPFYLHPLRITLLPSILHSTPLKPLYTGSSLPTLVSSLETWPSASILLIHPTSSSSSSSSKSTTTTTKIYGILLPSPLSFSHTYTRPPPNKSPLPASCAAIFQIIAEGISAGTTSVGTSGSTLSSNDSKITIYPIHAEAAATWYPYIIHDSSDPDRGMAFGSGMPPKVAKALGVGSGSGSGNGSAGAVAEAEAEAGANGQGVCLGVDGELGTGYLRCRRGEGGSFVMRKDGEGEGEEEFVTFGVERVEVWGILEKS